MPKEESCAQFKFVGWVADASGVMTSNAGNPYARVKIKTKIGVKQYQRNFWCVAFGDVAEEAGQADIGDYIELCGDIEPKRNIKTGSWDHVFVVRSYRLIMRAPENVVEKVKEAFDAEEMEDIPF